MTVIEVAKYLGFGVKEIQRMVDTGEIPCSRIAGHLLFLRPRIDEWIRAHELKPSVFCAGCNRVFTEPSLPPAKKKGDWQKPAYVRIKQYMDGGEYFCSACFAKTKPCPLCGKRFLPTLQDHDQRACPQCTALEAARKK